MILSLVLFLLQHVSIYAIQDSIEEYIKPEKNSFNYPGLLYLQRFSEEKEKKKAAIKNDEINNDIITSKLNAGKNKELERSVAQVVHVNKLPNVFGNYSKEIFGFSNKKLFNHNEKVKRYSGSIYDNIDQLHRNTFGESESTGIYEKKDSSPLNTDKVSFFRGNETNTLKASSKISIYKRSDIDDDQELLNTIEKLDPEIIMSKSYETNQKPLSGYMQTLAHDVRSVIGEAKDVLRHTGKVVHGLKRVINGATVLTSFTDNAIKFAKYFSIDPNNATIDYLEEKAIVAVLEAQKAASEAKEAAIMAKSASKKAKMAARKILTAEKKNKSLQSMIGYAHASVKQALLAEKAAKVAFRDKKKTEKDVMLMDNELKNLRSQLKFENEKQNLFKNETEELAQNIKQKNSLETRLLFTTLNETNHKPPNNLDLADKTEIKTWKQSEGKQFAAIKANKDSSYDYYLLKQKELENRNKFTNQNSERKSILLSNPKPKLASASILNQTITNTNKHIGDKVTRKQIEYILNLNQRINTAMSKEENKSNEIYKKIPSLSYNNFEIGKRTKKKKRFNSISNQFNAAVRNLLRYNKNNITKMTRPNEDETEVKNPKHSLFTRAHNDSKMFSFDEGLSFLDVPARSDIVHRFSREKYLGRSLKYAKKGNIQQKNRLLIHLLPGEYTGFKKDEIAPRKENMHDFNHTRYNTKAHTKNLSPKITFTKNQSTAVSEGFDQLVNGRVFSDENSIIADDFDQIKKRNQLLLESRFIDKNLLHLTEAEADFESASGSGVMPEHPIFDKLSVSKRKNYSIVRKITKGPVSVTVLVHHNIIPKLDGFHTKSLDLLDPFGFKRIGETNEGGIVDRRLIPRPNEDVKKKKNVILEKNQVKKTDGTIWF